MKDCRNAKDYLYMLSANQIKTFLRSILQLYESLTRILIWFFLFRALMSFYGFKIIAFILLLCRNTTTTYEEKRNKRMKLFSPNISWCVANLSIPLWLVFDRRSSWRCSITRSNQEQTYFTKCVFYLVWITFTCFELTRKYSFDTIANTLEWDGSYRWTAHKTYVDTNIIFGDYFLWYTSLLDACLH